MRFAKKVVVPVNMTENVTDVLHPLRDMEFLSHTEIHFVHAFSTIDYVSYLSEFPILYPLEADRKTIEQSIVALLLKISKEVLPNDFEGKVITKCLFDPNPKFRFTQYANDLKADMIIVPTRQKRGFFESSFAAYVIKHTHANVILLKDPNEIEHKHNNK